MPFPNRFVRDRGFQRLQECSDKVTQFETQISERSQQLDDLRRAISEIEKEINEGGEKLLTSAELRGGYVACATLNGGRRVT